MGREVETVSSYLGRDASSFVASLENSPASDGVSFFIES